MSRKRHLIMKASWQFPLSVTVSAQDGIVALREAHTRSAPVFRQSPMVALEIVPIFVWLNTDRSRPCRANVGRFLFSTSLSFRRSMLWCSGLSCSESSSSLWVSLPCQAADQMWYLQFFCLPVYRSVHSRCPGQLIHRSLCSRRLCMAVCNSGQLIPDSTFCRSLLSLWEWHVWSVRHAGRLAIV